MIPSLLQIPSAVSDSKLHSVLPNNGKGDFTFDRSTGATRINKDGLIEEVGYFSSELVQNGDFSELGSELITNGDFSSASDWSDVNNVSSIINGQLVFNNNSFGGKFQNTSMVVGKTYKLVYTIVSISNGYIQPRLGDTGLATQRTSAGTYTEYVVCAVDSIFRLYGASSDAIIDNVSVKQVDPNDRWDAEYYGTDVTITDTLNLVDNGNSGGAGVFQAISIKSGNTYKINFDITASTGSNIFAIQFCDTKQGGSQPFTDYFSEVGSYSVRLTAAIDNLGFRIRFARGTGKTVSIDNVSVVEVQGDRPRLSYDITNGVVEDKPHLLLEPSSTNLVTFSEDFSQSAWGKGDAQILSATHKNPDGTTNAKVLAYNGGTNQHYMQFTPSVSSGQNYTFSIFLKAKELKYVCLIFLNDFGGRYFDLENGTLLGTAGAGVDDSKIEDFGNGWYRCSITDSATSTTKFSGVYLSENGTSIGPFTPTTTNGVYVWGAMFEQNSFSTSYIKTAGTTITRAAETCNNSKPSVNSTEGVLYAEIAALAVESSVRQLAISDGTANEAVKILYLNSTQIRIELKTASGTDFVKDVTVTTNEFQKIALQYKASNYKVFLNGEAQSVTQTSAVASGLDRINFDRGDGGNDWYGKVKGLAVYNEALSESQLMQLTGVTASSIYSNFVTRTASFTVEALNEVKKVIDNL